jgi:putative acyl-CoA dehydrogenase
MDAELLPRDAMPSFQTHQVVNQVTPLRDYCLYDTDPVLRVAVVREGAATHEQALREHGTWLGREGVQRAAAQANRHPPELAAYDASGHRVDKVDFHPAWHLLLSGIVERGLHSAAWSDIRPGAHVARAAAYLLQGQVEAGTLCPVTMTFAAIPLLRDEPAIEIDFPGEWLPRAMSRRYDPADAPVGNKQGVLFGMGLTEKQGGSDLRAVSTRAEPVGAAGQGRAYLLTGHKWFYSVPHADAHLVLATTSDGQSCFFVPRWIPDGGRNAVRLRRLKDKLGNRSNASGEVEFEEAWGVMVDQPGRGLARLLDMAAVTRLDCVLASAALLRQGLVQALHHARHRHAFGKPLIDQALMRVVLADLALESEAAVALALRLARAMDERADPGARLLARIGTPAAKLWVCKRAIPMLAEAMEVCGGNGYVEESPMPRLYREAPVNSIWEGAGNIMALDVPRALQREAGARDAVLAELQPACAASPVYARALRSWMDGLDDALAHPEQARALSAGLARLWQAALLLRHAPSVVADAYVRTRLEGAGGVCGESLNLREADALLARAWPAIC